ncbi:P-II family nitrogen regulator [Atopococcus tabaci]|uniref:P-II family nitrogen regulator n=1 Tax=Atopococcus tabaci TaxID=269774 RepID=UPI0004153E4D|nr:P-II family nitrogen regulator [Atopococcus tabaci]
MSDMPLEMDMHMLCLILNDDEGSKVLKIAREHEIMGGTVFYGEGTVRKKMMRFLGLDNVRREIVLLVGSKNAIDDAFQALAFRLHLDRPNHGIGFTVPLSRVLGVHAQPIEGERRISKKRKEAADLSQAIITIVERGQAEDVMEAAQKAGAQGGTIIHARGTGAKQARLVFNMEIEPEKDIVLIIAEKTTADDIVEAISKELDIEKPNRGVLFTMDLAETRGIV